MAKEIGLMKKKYGRQGLLQVELTVKEIQGTPQCNPLAFEIKYNT